MAELQREIDPDEVGLDPARLPRIDEHFRRYVDDGRLPGWSIVVARGGKVAYLSTYGHRDKEAGIPVEHDTVFRIYSMTKPVTSVALMMLWEEARFDLRDPVHRYIPAFKAAKVWKGGSTMSPQLQPMAEPMRVWHLLTHTSGLSYGFHFAHPVDELYRKAGFEWGAPKGMDLEQVCDAWAELPLVCQPGTRWNYSVSTDVCGRLVEVLSGQPLDVFLEERIFGPLGMVDTAFFADEARQERLAALYIPEGGKGKAVRFDPMGKLATRKPTFLSGGGGLVSTAGDYHRFVQCVLNGGELDGVRLLSPRTVEMMARNHLPGGVDMAAIAEQGMTELAPEGIGFGLGFAVTLDPAVSRQASTEGDLSWGGAASTGFWIDPAEDLSVVFMTQLLPSSTHPLRPELRQLVYQAIAD